MKQQVNEESVRQELLETACDALLESGFRAVKGQLEGQSSPDAIDGLLPDLQGENAKGVRYCFVVETEVTLARPETAERIHVFAKHALEQGERCVIIVPEGDEGVAGAVLEECQIPEDNVEVWEG